MKRRQVLEAFRDNGAIRRQTAVGFRRRLMQRADAQIIDQRHIGGFHVLEHLVRASGKADHRIMAEQDAARLDGDIGLANMYAINLYSLLTSSIYRIQAIIDEQRHSVLRTGLPYDLGCLGRAGDELASRALLRADLHAGEPCRDGLGHHIGNGSAQGVFRTQDQICGNIQIVSHAHAIPPFRHLRRRHRFQGLSRRFEPSAPSCSRTQGARRPSG